MVTINFITAMFYFTLANIHPKFRSKLRGIQLLALCKQKYLKKYGINVILHRFIEDIKKLVSACIWLIKYTRNTINVIGSTKLMFHLASLSMHVRSYTYSSKRDVLAY